MHGPPGRPNFQRTRTKARVPALVWVCALALAAGCVMVPSAPPRPVDDLLLAAALKRGSDEATIRRGHDLFVTKCGRCHSPVDPAGYDEIDWDDIMPRMARKAGVDKAGAADIRAYMLAARDCAPPKPVIPAKE